MAENQDINIIPTMTDQYFMPSGRFERSDKEKPLTDWEIYELEKRELNNQFGWENPFFQGQKHYEAAHRRLIEELQI